ncbi:hypothetical protein B0T26DRAFT_496053 [Lasiosphaeria miniovina]|uniref:Uncharacterized protein n=1 Tax=Lasiosphaeria miniovina TaxID=1954250 RepID=A0AA39ZTI0_9PEZI|nr:uncharacterized protein B0T26DRAFT_496053 [Lasiosphaeria miniovina]KAK0703352.1 hypothetical protein B0T26DRAFT_496053 [Lasiosphaeria miniovina]
MVRKKPAPLLCSGNNLATVLLLKRMCTWGRPRIVTYNAASIEGQKVLVFGRFRKAVNGLACAPPAPICGLDAAPSDTNCCSAANFIWQVAGPAPTPKLGKAFHYQPDAFPCSMDPPASHSLSCAK